MLTGANGVTMQFKVKSTDTTELEKAATITVKGLVEKAQAELDELVVLKGKYDTELGRRKDQDALYKTASEAATEAVKLHTAADTLSKQFKAAMLLT